jgi:hypothetical protein
MGFGGFSVMGFFQGMAGKVIGVSAAETAKRREEIFAAGSSCEVAKANEQSAAANSAVVYDVPEDVEFRPSGVQYFGGTVAPAALPSSDEADKRLSAAFDKAAAEGIDAIRSPQMRDADDARVAKMMAAMSEAETRESELASAEQHALAAQQSPQVGLNNGPTQYTQAQLVPQDWKDAYLRLTGSRFGQFGNSLARLDCQHMFGGAVIDSLGPCACAPQSGNATETVVGVPRGEMKVRLKAAQNAKIREDALASGRVSCRLIDDGFVSMDDVKDWDYDLLDGVYCERKAAAVQSADAFTAAWLSHQANERGEAAKLSYSGAWPPPRWKAPGE